MPDEKAMKRAEKFRSMAATLAKKIDEKRNPATADQNPTPRRIRMIEAMGREADNLEQLQQVMLGMATALDEDALPESLKFFSTRSRIESLLIRGRTAFDRLSESDQTAYTDMQPYIEGPSEADQKARELRDLENSLVGTKIPGFFPTPPDLVAELIRLAELEQADARTLALEPGAGKGDIADALKAAGVTVACCEINYTLRGILEAKGHDVVEHDFFDYRPGPVFDVVVMNPPFEKGQDAEHVQHAYELLKPGGRLVAIVSEGLFHRQDGKAVAFRSWLRECESDYTDRISDGFKKAFRATGVSVRIIVADKPAEESTAPAPTVTELPTAARPGWETLTAIQKREPTEEYYAQWYSRRWADWTDGHGFDPLPPISEASAEFHAWLNTWDPRNKPTLDVHYVAPDVQAEAEPVAVAVTVDERLPAPFGDTFKVLDHVAKGCPESVPEDMQYPFFSLLEVRDGGLIEKQDTGEVDYVLTPKGRATYEQMQQELAPAEEAVDETPADAAEVVHADDSPAEQETEAETAPVDESAAEAPEIVHPAEPEDDAESLDEFAERAERETGGDFSWMKGLQPTKPYQKPTPVQIKALYLVENHVADGIPLPPELAEHPLIVEAIANLEDGGAIYADGDVYSFTAAGAATYSEMCDIFGRPEVTIDDLNPKQEDGPVTTEPDAVPQPVDAAELQLVAMPLANIIPSPNNKRHLPDDRSLEVGCEVLRNHMESDETIGHSGILDMPLWRGLYELAKSIKGQGLAQPGVARPAPDPEARAAGKVELCCGHRRLVAHRIAGLPTMLISVRDLDDQQAAELTSVENLQRSDLTPIEEGEQIAVLLEKGWDIEGVAAHIGKSPNWVYRRAQVSKLSPAWREALQGTETRYGNWGAGHFELIARLPEATQDGLLQDLNDRYAVPGTLAQLKDATDRHMRKLSAAIWPLDDAELLPAAGGCAGCPKRSGCQRELFEEMRGDDDRCLDPACWLQKTDAFVMRRAQQLQEEHGDDVALGFPHYGAGDKPETWEAAKMVHTYQISTKKQKGHRPVLMVAGEHAGKVVYLPTPAGRDVGADGKVKPKTLAERREGLQHKRNAWAVKHVEELLMADDSHPHKILEAEDPLYEMLALVVGFGVSSCLYTNGFNRMRDHWDCAAEAASIEIEELLNLSWHQVRDELRKTLQFDTQERSTHCVPDAEKVCDILSVSWADILKDAVEACPEPKSWAKLNADGTPKTKKPATPTKAKGAKRAGKSADKGVA